MIRASPIKRSSHLASANPKVVNTPWGSTVRAILKPYTHSVLETRRPRLALPVERLWQLAWTRWIAGIKVVCTT
ncbi:MAG TPA: hypothetical protein VFS96_04750, partial [Nitrolancea sp.]|nr:hypothetical protein [Nitrolancea sp.]